MVEKQDAPKAGEEDRAEIGSGLKDVSGKASEVMLQDVFKTMGKDPAITDCGFDKAGQLMDKLPANGTDKGSQVMEKLPADSKTDKGELKSQLKDLNDKKLESATMLMREFPSFKTEGTHDYKTGDRLVVKDGKETLVTPSGDIFTVDQNGKVKVEGDVKAVETNAKGFQTYTMSDGAKIGVGPMGIASIERNGRTVNLISDKLFSNPLAPIFQDRPTKDPHWDWRNKLESK